MNLKEREEKMIDESRRLMDMKTIESGSTGNCASLMFTEDDNQLLVLFDLGLSFAKIERFISEMYDVDFRSTPMPVLLLITHEHGDHWNPKTYHMICRHMGEDNVKLVFPLPKDLNDDEYSTQWHDHTIDVQQFKHGKIHTNFFVVDNAYGYLTDCTGGDQLLDLLMWDKPYGLRELFIEANYDESYFDLRDQASIAVGYDPEKGFSRHLSRQESDYLISCYKPKFSLQTHKSSRFYNTLEEKKQDGNV